MIVKATQLDGVFEIENKVFEDHRGKFVKTFHEDAFKSHGLEYDFKESFYSVSKKTFFEGCIFNYPLMIMLNWFMLQMVKFWMLRLIFAKIHQLLENIFLQSFRQAMQSPYI